MIKININQLVTTYSLRVISLCIVISFTISLGVGYTQTKTENTVPRTLSEAYDDMFKIGVALNQWQVEGKVTKATPLITKHFNTITPENMLKWTNVHPKPDEYNFKTVDRYVEFGEAHDIFIVGHTLVWHSQIPNWTFVNGNGDQLEREALLQRMKDHIFTVVDRYKGRIDAWDVVNEAATWSDGLRKSKWFKIIGNDYIDKAFQYAHEADPDAELYYNDYNLWVPDKREIVVNMVERLQKNGIPIDGIGMQAHLGLHSPSLDKIEASIKAFSRLDVKVMITELDVSVLPSQDDVNASYNPEDEYQSGGGDVPTELNPYTEALPDSVQQQLKNRYIKLFKLFKKHQDKIDRVTFWGLNDGQSWLNNFPIPGRTDYPLLFNRNYEPKPAFHGILEVAESQEEN